MHFFLPHFNNNCNLNIKKCSFHVHSIIRKFRVFIFAFYINVQLYNIVHYSNYKANHRGIMFWGHFLYGLFIHATFRDWEIRDAYWDDLLCTDCYYMSKRLTSRALMIDIQRFNLEKNRNRWVINEFSK